MLCGRVSQQISEKLTNDALASGGNAAATTSLLAVNVLQAYVRLRVAIDSVRRTAMPLSCAAEAHVVKPRGAAAAAHTAGRQRVICSRRDTALVLFSRGASESDRSSDLAPS